MRICLADGWDWVLLDELVDLPSQFIGLVSEGRCNLEDFEDIEADFV